MSKDPRPADKTCEGEAMMFHDDAGVHSSQNDFSERLMRLGHLGASLLRRKL